jgi:hypothetical protein
MAWVGAGRVVGAAYVYPLSLTMRLPRAKDREQPARRGGNRCRGAAGGWRHRELLSWRPDQPLLRATPEASPPGPRVSRYAWDARLPTERGHGISPTVLARRTSDRRAASRRLMVTAYKPPMSGDRSTIAIALAYPCAALISKRPASAAVASPRKARKILEIPSIGVERPGVFGWPKRGCERVRPDTDPRVQDQGTVDVAHNPCFRRTSYR